MFIQHLCKNHRKKILIGLKRFSLFLLIIVVFALIIDLYTLFVIPGVFYRDYSIISFFTKQEAISIFIKTMDYYNQNIDDFDILYFEKMGGMMDLNHVLIYAKINTVFKINDFYESVRKVHNSNVSSCYYTSDNSAISLENLNISQNSSDINRLNKFIKFFDPNKPYKLLLCNNTLFVYYPQENKIIYLYRYP